MEPNRVREIREVSIPLLNENPHRVARVMVVASQE